MVSTWISLPAEHNLPGVQASLTVLVSVLCALTIFCYVRTGWISTTRRSAKGKNVALSSFVVIGSLGEVVDALIVLGTRLLSIRHFQILAQCIVVVVFSAASLLAGYVGRYATRQGYEVREQQLDGYLADRLSASMGFANVQWNQTYSRLDEAGFPLDQLLDYLPADDVNWKYDQAQWNNSWTMICQITPETSMTLETTGYCSDSIATEIPALAEILAHQDYEVSADSWSGFEWKNRWRDVLLFSTAKAQSSYANYDGTNTSISLSIAAIHMHNVTKNLNTSSTCQYGTGDVGSSTLTKIDCKLTRLNKVPDANNTAFPDIPAQYQKALSEAFTAFYGARLAQESATKSPITIIQPDQLTRFYQTYTAVKDMQYRQPVTRPIDVGEDVVQVSIIFLAVAGLIALFIVLGLLNYLILIVFQNRAFRKTPLTRLEWMIQSIGASTNNATGISTLANGAKHSVTVPPEIAAMAAADNRLAFETAVYARTGGAGGGKWTSHRDSTASTAYAGSPESQYSKYQLAPVRSQNQWEQQMSPPIVGYEGRGGGGGSGKTPLLGTYGYE